MKETSQEKEEERYRATLTFNPMMNDQKSSNGAIRATLNWLE